MLSRKKFHVHTACNTGLPAAMPGLPHLHGAGHPQCPGQERKGFYVTLSFTDFGIFETRNLHTLSKMFYSMYMRAFSEQTAGSQLGASHTGSESNLVTAGFLGPPFSPSTSTAEWGSAGKPKGFTCIKCNCDFTCNKHFY